MYSHIFFPLLVGVVVVVFSSYFSYWMVDGVFLSFSDFFVLNASSRGIPLVVIPLLLLFSASPSHFLSFSIWSSSLLLGCPPILVMMVGLVVGAWVVVVGLDTKSFETKNLLGPRNLS